MHIIIKINADSNVVAKELIDFIEKINLKEQLELLYPDILKSIDIKTFIF